MNFSNAEEQIRLALIEAETRYQEAVSLLRLIVVATNEKNPERITFTHQRIVRWLLINGHALPKGNE